MAKRKADALVAAQSRDGAKKIKFEKPNLLDDSSSDSGSDNEGGVALTESADAGFKINEEYAKRFEHNKKREELHRLEEKYKKPQQFGKKNEHDDEDDDDSSTDGEEDDEGELATGEVEEAFHATLQALKNKDPRLYDEKVKFFPDIPEPGEEQPAGKKEKPMYLRDYHRENLLKGNIGADDEDDEDAPQTFAQEQDALKKTVVKEMHAAAEEDDDDEDDFLVAKSKPETSSGQGIHPSRQSNVKIDLDVENADKDPETFLSNFMAARAWVPTDGARFKPLESDDEEEEARADAFEAAYNLRFEDPSKSNELLTTYARDVINDRSVRRTEVSGRKKARQAERERKEAEKREREEERARLRRLKIEEMEEKLQKIKKAAGLKGKALKDEEWMKFLDDNWDDEQWEAEMNKRFGDEYYSQKDKEWKDVEKPEWDDDIDIKDLVPDFEEEEEQLKKPAFTLSDSEAEEDADADAMDVDEDEGSDADETSAKKAKSSKDRKKELQEKKKAARLERKKIEELVDTRLVVDTALMPLASSSKKAAGTFRYRETSPTSFGLTPRDILNATDADLNTFAGLKKMAPFRDPEKKRKDKRRLNKKQRLREWRKETFGAEEPPEFSIERAAAEEASGEGDGVDIREGKKKRKRSKKGKGKVEA